MRTANHFSMFIKPVLFNQIYEDIQQELKKNTWIYFLLLFFLALCFIFQTFPAAFGWNSDSPTFYTAAVGISHHTNIYENEAFQTLAESLFGKNLAVNPYIYCPLMAQAFLPFTFLDTSTYPVVLYVLNLVLCFASIFLTYSLIGKGGQRLLSVFLLAIFHSFYSLTPWDFHKSKSDVHRLKNQDFAFYLKSLERIYEETPTYRICPRLTSCQIFRGRVIPE